MWTVVRETEDDDPGKAKVVGEEMKRLIEGAVGSLRRLRSFWWSICPNDPQFTHSAVMNGIKTLPNLESIQIDLCVSTTALQLDSLKKLDEDRHNGVLRRFPQDHCRSVDHSHFEVTPLGFVGVWYWVYERRPV